MALETHGTLVKGLFARCCRLVRQICHGVIYMRPWRRRDAISTEAVGRAALAGASVVLSQLESSSVGFASDRSVIAGASS